MLMKKICLIGSLFISLTTIAQDAATIINKVKAKLDVVTDYEADGKMKTDVAFIKAPLGKVKVYYKKPNLFKLKKEGGISLLPKGGVSVNMNSLVNVSDFLAIDAGETTINNTKVKIIKLLPNNDNADVVLTTMYIDVPNLLIKKSVTTTKENGTYDIEMNYGKYAEYGLPDKMVFSFNTKDYKLPKGITLEFGDDEKPASEAEKLKNKKGRVEIIYQQYSINKGLSSAIFK
jgi:hypothetical protein